MKRQLAIFESGRYIYEIEECTFDMAEHNALLDATRDEVKAMKARQAKAQAEMDKLEAELMAKWTKKKAAGKIPMDKVEALLNGLSSFSDLYCLLSPVLSRLQRDSKADDECSCRS